MRRQSLIAAVLAGALIGSIIGCQNPTPSSPAALADFQQAGPVAPLPDPQAAPPAGPAPVYRAAVGDVLEFQMPAVLTSLPPEQRPERASSCLCRVEADGTISLPIIGPMPAAGLSLAQIEANAAELYHPKHMVHRPAIVARVADYSVAQVTITGAVKQPGVYGLRSDERSLVALLAKAGNIINEGAYAIRIRRAEDPLSPSTQPADPSDQPARKLISVPIRGLNMPFADVALAAGDTVEVERLSQPTVTVIGLVGRPGVYPYPADTTWTLAQALAAGGGLNPIADPQYAKVYRQDASGKIVAATVPIAGQGGLGRACAMTLKPGDVVDVEQTSETKTRLALANALRFGLGGGVTYVVGN